MTVEFWFPIESVLPLAEHAATVQARTDIHPREGSLRSVAALILTIDERGAVLASAVPATDDRPQPPAVRAHHRAPQTPAPRPRNNSGAETTATRLAIDMTGAEGVTVLHSVRPAQREGAAWFILQIGDGGRVNHATSQLGPPQRSTRVHADRVLRRRQRRWGDE